MSKAAPTRDGFLSVNIPFDGFYESLYSSEVDSYEEREAEYYEERELETEPLEHLRLNASEFADFFMDCADYQKIYAAIAATYAAAFNNEASDELGFKLGLEYESMDSPRFYNYGTDRLFSYMPVATAQALFDMSAAQNHSALADAIGDRFTSRPGFSSYYNNELDSWLTKPLIDWDHNELSTLLQAMIYNKEDERDFRLRVYYATFDCDGVTHEYESGFDYAKFDENVRKLKNEKDEQFKADNGIAVFPVSKCARTPDLFK